jgi:hypothetical protein
MAKYYTKKQDVVIARQYNGNPIKGVTVRANKGYVTVDGGLVTLQLRDWILIDDNGKRAVVSNVEFCDNYEFLREDDYDEDNLVDIGKELYKDVVYEDNYSYENSRRKNGSKKRTK